jgi:hypothetical protein
MNYSLSISEAADLDIKDAYIYYDNINTDLSLAFKKIVNKIIESIQDIPLIYF